MTAPARRPWRRLALAGWAVLLAASWGARALAPEPPAPGSAVLVDAVRGDRREPVPVAIAWRERPAPAAAAGATPVLLLHGSPGRGRDLDALASALGVERRVVVPDLPGFGDSTRHVPDYSIRAHARYGLDLLDRLGLERVHVVGFSMGGGVALELYQLAPERVASVTLLASIGVQELELFGSYELNRLVHRAQLVVLSAVDLLVPHFGLLDRAMLGVPYARNFLDTDQRPLRGVLERLEPPALIVHGASDPLVPLAAAEEHHRIVPHSEIVRLDGSHFDVFVRPATVATPIAAFLRRVDAGGAPARPRASPERLAAAARPFDPASLPELHGVALALTTAFLAVATLVSEDLACIGAGLLVGRGRLAFEAAVAACLAGILAGDLLLFAAGRWLGRPVLRRAPLRWLVDETRVEVASRWFERRGAAVVLLSRFVPGTRLPAYLAAGLLGTSAWRFGAWFLLAVALWTPLVVGLAATVGERAFGAFEAFERHATWAALALGAWILLVVRVGIPLASRRGRRLLVGRFRRFTRWEFWPPWLFYPPVVAWVVLLGIRHRAPLLFTAANPGMPAGGFVAESKLAILEALAGAGPLVARTELVPAAAGVDERIARAARFVREEGGFPVVLKPDVGQRGDGVAVVRDRAALERYLRAARGDVLVQRYVPGEEYGVFYYRYPGEARGRILSITEKKMPEIVGDGRRTVEELILDDPRAVALAELYLARQAHRLVEVPAPGERIRLVELGTHCRGAIFLDGARLATPALERRIDEVSRACEGFWFGRYDVRCAGPEALAAGSFTILELNGVTSEATHIYDPRHGLLHAWGVLFEQWRIAFEIGRRNRDRGAVPAGAAELLRLVRAWRAGGSAPPDAADA